jgi:hypothetical protein
MSKATSPIPAGHEGLIPHLVCDPCTGAATRPTTP